MLYEPDDVKLAGTDAPRPDAFLFSKKDPSATHFGKMLYMFGELPYLSVSG